MTLFVNKYLARNSYFFILFSGDSMKYKFLEKLNSDNSNKSHRFMKFINKCLSAVLIGLIALIVMEYSPKFKTFMKEEVLSKNISFGFLGKLYNKYFGEILPESNTDSVVKVFNEKLSFQKIEKHLEGANLTVDKNYLVPAVNSGVVVFIGDKEDIGKVVVIEQIDKTTITYGNILNTSLKLYDYVEKGSFIGEVNDTNLYLSVLKDNEYLNVETYIS